MDRKNLLELRHRKLAQALRDNLKKRKQQQRDRSENILSASPQNDIHDYEKINEALTIDAISENNHHAEIDARAQ